MKAPGLLVPIWAPVYSPELNPIEYVFSKLKKKVKHLRLQDMIHNRKRPFDELVPISANEVTVGNVNRCI